MTSRPAPQEKSYYVIVSGVFRFPSTLVAPPQVTVTAERVRYINGHATPTGESAEIPLVMVTQSQSGAPVVNSDGTTTYTYRTHDLTDDEETPRRKAGQNDWHIDDKLGRWQFTVKDYPSNTVEFKVDKRGQVVGYAYDIADYETFNPQGSGAYDQCDGFVNLVYGRHGLEQVGKSSDSCAIDGGEGALRFFEMKPPGGNYPSTFVTPPFSSAGHVAIQGASQYWGRQMVDNNWDNSGVGPTVRSFDAGTGVPWSVTASYWDNAISGAPFGQFNSSISILQELDGE